MSPLGYLALAIVFLALLLFFGGWLWGVLFVVSLVMAFREQRKRKALRQAPPYQPGYYQAPPPPAQPAGRPPYPLYCPNCGQQLTGYQDTCPRCGYRMSQA